MPEGPAIQVPLSLSVSLGVNVELAPFLETCAEQPTRTHPHLSLKPRRARSHLLLPSCTIVPQVQRRRHCPMRQLNPYSLHLAHRSPVLRPPCPRPS